jgi:hypothetical protein
MSGSSYCDQRAIVRHRASGYDAVPGGRTLVRAQYISMKHPFGAGALCSTALDLVAWNRALHGGRIVGRAAYEEMIRPAALADGTKLRYGLGLALNPIAGRRAISHGGDIPGFATFNAWFPDDDAHIVVLINSQGPVRPEAIAEQIAARVLGPAPSAPAVALAPSDVQRYVGTYSFGPVTVQVSEQGGGVRILRNGRPVTVTYRGGDTFAGGDGIWHFIVANGRTERLFVDETYSAYTLPRR